MDEKPDIKSKKFIKENVSKKRTPTEKMILHILKVIGLGVLFGISALITMVLLRPAALRYLSSGAQSDINSGKNDTIESTEVAAGSESVPSSDTTSDTASGATSDAASVTTASAVTATTEDHTESVSDTAAESSGSSAASESGASSAKEGGAESDDVRQGSASSDDGVPDAETLSAMWKEISDTGNRVDKYIVDVCSIQNATDWFDNHFEKKDVYSGIIISAEDSEVCVLTLASAVSSADSLRISLTDGRLFPATLKKTDSLTGLAVISFDPEDENMISAETIEETYSQAESDKNASGSTADGASTEKEYEPFEAITFDTSGTSAKRGDLVIAAGAPKGISHSIACTWLSYVSEPVSITDGTTRLFYADRDIDSSKGTWIIDMEGNLIGWLCDDIKEDSADSQVIMSIADYRDILETMVNGEDRAYLGVSVVDMDTIHSGPDYPEGVYVKSVTFGGPAYNSGLQPGDYIADIGGHRINSLRSFKYALNHIQAGSTVTILIYRQSKEEYKNIVFEVETGLRSAQ